MTLRAYAAWLAEADQRAAPILAGRMPGLPDSIQLNTGPVAYHHQTDADDPDSAPYLQLARDLRGAIAVGAIGGWRSATDTQGARGAIWHRCRYRPQSDRAPC
jgi:hypothetical protein